MHCAFQKVFFWFFKAFPKTFDKIADLADKHYFTKKDTKDQSWLKVQVPQPGIDPKEALIPTQDVHKQYAGNVISARCQVPCLYKFELMGTPEDVERVKIGVNELWQHQPLQQQPSSSVKSLVQ